MPSQRALVIFATSWGSNHGGINSFNMDLCSSLPRVLASTYNVICVLPTLNQDGNRLPIHAGVRLLSLSASHNQDQLEANRAFEVVDLLRNTDVVWWIGHDVVSGEIALECRRLAGGKTAIIHHMDYSAYLAYKEPHPRQLQQAIEGQRSVLASADRVLAVGPKLAESARRMRADHGAISEIIPGLANVERWDISQRFSAITFGRLDPANNRVKQARLAVAAFGRVKSRSTDQLGYDATLTIIGLSNDTANSEARELQILCESEAGRAVPINAFPYTESRERLLDELRRHNACMMLSLHEGFGLVGWEAIATEVPLIVSKNSGLYSFIDRTLEGLGTGLVQGIDILGSMMGDEAYKPADIERVADALVWVKMNPQRAKNDARKLKGLLQRFYTWDNTAVMFAEALGIEVHERAVTRKITGWNVDLLVEALTTSPDLVNQATRRKTLFQQLWDMMKSPSSFNKRLILFGGVSSALCDEAAARQYADWLRNNPGARLYVCYETGRALEERAQKLDPAALETESGLPAEAAHRLIIKEQRARALRDLVIALLQPQEEPETETRIISIPLPEALTTYIIVADNQVFLTPLLETRSTETLSFALAGHARQFHLDVIQYIEYYLKTFQPTAEAENLIAELRTADTEILGERT